MTYRRAEAHPAIGGREARRVGLVGVLLLIGLPATAHTAPSPAGDILFVRDGGIRRIDAALETDSVEVVALEKGQAAQITALQASAAGDLVLVRLGDRWHWTALPRPAGDDDDRAEAGSGAATLQPLDCYRDAELSADGDWVLCAGADDVAVVYRLRPRIRKVARLLPPRQLHFHGPGGAGIVAHQGESLWSIPVRGRERPRLLASHQPVRDLLPAPDGRRAVGAYDDSPDDPDDDQTVLYTFRLNGRSIKRRLISGTPIVWSADSRWLLVQSDHRACIVRGVGGEFKCWDRYTAVAMSPDGGYALVGKDGNLYRAELAGARPARPKLLLKNVGPHAVWTRGFVPTPHQP
jgi:hypothetical protein